MIIFFNKMYLNIKFLLFFLANPNSTESIQCLKQNRTSIWRHTVNFPKRFKTFSNNLENLPVCVLTHYRQLDSYFVVFFAVDWLTTLQLTRELWLPQTPKHQRGANDEHGCQLHCRVSDVFLQKALTCHFEKLRKSVCSHLTAREKENKY